MPVKEKTPLKSERSNTDGSLSVERKRTDSALAATRSDTERVADKEVEDARRKLDVDMAGDRAKSDNGEPSGTANEKVQDERRIADERTSIERKKTDDAHDRERKEQKSGEGKLLTDERHGTDTNLSLERKRSDIAYEYAADLLTAEKKAHALTRVAVATRDEFLAMVSHDLRSPLNIIKMCADELTDACTEGRLSDLEAQWVDTIRRHTASMSRLISDLLDVERMINGELPLTRVPSNVTSLIVEVVSAFQVWAKKLNVSLTSNLPANGLVAHVDRERIRQVLSNLISNALKFTPKGGVVSVSAKQMDDVIRVDVTDSGSGIPEDQLEHVFDRFSQLNKRDRRGVGLGLYISRWIVEAHDGKISAISELGVGSTFQFSLPRIGI